MADYHHIELMKDMQPKQNLITDPDEVKINKPYLSAENNDEVQMNTIKVQMNET